MHIEQLFCWAMTDLDACILSTWQYHQMRIAGLLRLLVFDEKPLALQINREFRRQLRFFYYDAVTLEEPSSEKEIKAGSLSFAIGELDPRPILYAGGTANGVPLKEWLSVGAMRLQGRVVTVREFVQQMAYVEGLVHAQPPKDEFEQLLVLMRTAVRRLDTLSLVGYDLLKQIGRITHSGLLPLFGAVQSKRLHRDGPYPRFSYE